MKDGTDVKRLLQLAAELLERWSLLPQHPTMAQVEQLAQEIVAYRAVMNVSGYILVSVPEVVSRFSEPPRVAREALRLLESQGVAIHTEFRDRWAVRC